MSSTRSTQPTGQPADVVVAVLAIAMLLAYLWMPILGIVIDRL